MYKLLMSVTLLSLFVSLPVLADYQTTEIEIQCDLFNEPFAPPFPGKIRFPASVEDWFFLPSENGRGPLVASTKSIVLTFGVNKYVSRGRISSFLPTTYRNANDWKRYGFTKVNNVVVELVNIKTHEKLLVQLFPDGNNYLLPSGHISKWPRKLCAFGEATSERE